MLIRVDSDSLPEENLRCINDLMHNANSKEYTNVKGFKQKLIDLLYHLDYYKFNESIFSE